MGIRLIELFIYLHGFEGEGEENKRVACCGKQNHIKMDCMHAWTGRVYTTSFVMIVSEVGTDQLSLIVAYLILLYQLYVIERQI